MSKIEDTKKISTHINEWELNKEVAINHNGIISKDGSFEKIRGLPSYRYIDKDYYENKTCKNEPHKVTESYITCADIPSGELKLDQEITYNGTLYHIETAGTNTSRTNFTKNSNTYGVYSPEEVYSTEYIVKLDHDPDHDIKSPPELQKIESEDVITSVSDSEKELNETSDCKYRGITIKVAVRCRNCGYKTIIEYRNEKDKIERCPKCRSTSFLHYKTIRDCGECNSIWDNDRVDYHEELMFKKPTIATTKSRKISLTAPAPPSLKTLGPDKICNERITPVNKEHIVSKIHGEFKIYGELKSKKRPENVPVMEYTKAYAKKAEW